MADALADPAMAPATEVTKANGPGKLLLPVLVGVLLLPAALGSSQTIFNDGDVSWHIATGQWILDHRAIPHDRSLFLHLGGQAVGADRMAGRRSSTRPPIGLAAKRRRRAGNRRADGAPRRSSIFNASRWVRVPRCLPIVAMDFVLIPMMLARPHLLTWPLLALWIWLMLRARERDRAPPLIAAALIMTLWANLHGGFVFGLRDRRGVRARSADRFAGQGARVPPVAGVRNRLRARRLHQRQRPRRGALTRCASRSCRCCR